MGQTRRLGKTATSVRADHNGTHVRYHETDVVTFTPEKVILRTGGWYTNTTKTRMNQAARQFSLPYGVSQRKGRWYVSRWNETMREWVEEVPFDASGVHTFIR